MKGHKVLPSVIGARSLLRKPVFFSLLGFLFVIYFYSSPSPFRSSPSSSPIIIPDNYQFYSTYRPPPHPAVVMPSVRISAAEETFDRKIYGGAGDKAHLGGFTELDLMGISPAVWTLMLQYFGVKSMLDVGCGKGVSTTWFALHGVDALCVEGSHDAVEINLMPDKAKQVVEHDFSRGPWWPSKTVDAVWCVEFTEHVGRNFHANYLPAFHQAALIFVSHSHWGGWHHVEVHNDVWWKAKFQAHGFVYSEDLTQMVRETAKKEKQDEIAAFRGQNYNAQHVWTTMQVFINPAVASLPQHAHLFAEDGCYEGRENGQLVHKPCGEYVKRDGTKDSTHTAMDPNFLPLEITPEQDEKWKKLIQTSLPPVDEPPNEI